MGTLIAAIILVGIVVILLSNSNTKESTKTSRRRLRLSSLIGGGLGWAFGGPIGAILGYAIGSRFDKSKISEEYSTIGANESQRNFNVSLLVLSAAVMKADGVVRRSELDYVKNFYLKNFGEERAKRYIQLLKNILEQPIDVKEVSTQIASYMDYSSRLQLLHYLFGIALADGFADPSEVEMISTISSYLRISSSDYESIKAMFVVDTDGPYKILEIEPTASDDEVKKAYREMAKKYHPDKVSHLGEDVRKSAEQKFQEVNAAYDAIRKQRGF